MHLLFLIELVWIVLCGFMHSNPRLFHRLEFFFLIHSTSSMLNKTVRFYCTSKHIFFGAWIRCLMAHKLILLGYPTLISWTVQFVLCFYHIQQFHKIIIQQDIHLRITTVFNISYSWPSWPSTGIPFNIIRRSTCFYYNKSKCNISWIIK